MQNSSRGRFVLLSSAELIEAMATLLVDSLQVLNDTEAEAEAFVESVMASQRFTKVDTTNGNGRKRNLSLPSEVSAACVKKAKGGCGNSNGGLRSNDSGSDNESGDSSESENAVNVDESAREDPKPRKYKQARKTVGRNIIVTEAEVHTDSDPSIKQLIAKLSSDMHMLYSALSERMDKLESSLEQKLSTKVAQLLDKRVNTELGRIKKEVDANLVSFKETLRDEIDEELGEINNKLHDLSNRPMSSVRFDQNDRSLNVAIRDLPESANENLNSKVNALIKNGLNIRDVSVSNTERKESRVQSRPGVVIATFKSADDKRKVMSEKSKLKNSRHYDKVFIQHDQTREQRLLAGNFRTVINAINGGTSNVSFRGMLVVRNVDDNSSSSKRQEGNPRDSTANDENSRRNLPNSQSNNSRDSRENGARGSGHTGYRGNRRGRGRGSFRGGNRR